jgi:DNA-binding beta-propeller fold protein YncE
VPSGIACEGSALAVADAWNHRVLLWHDGLTRSHQPPDVVLGQQDRKGGLANRGQVTPRADTLNWCYGVALAGGRLFIADTGNRRVLVFDKLPTRDGASADLVLGERDFVTRDENAGGPAGPVGMRWPHGIAVADGALLVADAGDNRVMVWRALPRVNGAPCDFVLGQRDCTLVDHNQAAYLPTASAMNMPYGLAVLGKSLVVADTANSRLLGFDLEKLSPGASARSLAGQPAFTDKGDNRWTLAARDSVCWPYAVAASGSTLVVADSGNNRVLLWERAP